ncbi:MAG: glycosyltransferase, partial [Coleofasciculus sp. S288]|nr:glycosyltransferase [Coleofasciculus sp. S288]
MVRVSIVVTTYNRLPLLKRAVESALAQTYPCEVVIADDGSTDGTEDYVRSLSDRVVYHRNSVNSGHSATVNAGVRVATGDWIKPIDDDDYLASNCIEEMVRAIAGCPQAVIFSCQAIQVDVNGVEISRTHLGDSSKAFYVPQEDIHYGMLMEMVPFGTPVQVAFAKDAFVKSGGWDSAFDGNCDDIESWIRIAQFGDAVFLNQCLAYRTVWPGGISKQLSIQKRLEKNILIKEKIYQLVDEKYKDDIPAIKDIRAYLRLHWSLVAVKHKQFLTALKIGYPVVFSPVAWI